MRGLGTDLVDLARFAAVLERTPSIVGRLFTEGERLYCEGPRRVERYAARFAAKEAALKAMGCGLGACAWHEIEVTRHDSGAPSLRVTGRAADLAAQRGVVAWHVTLAHDARAAIATVATV
ncbi:MAG: holo-ACP synthase [Acidimicrobiales bacterium]